MKCSNQDIKKSLTIFHVEPLDILVSSSFRKISVNILEFVFLITCPCDIVIIDCDVVCNDGSICAEVELVPICENGFGNETAWNSWIITFQGNISQILLLVVVEVTHFDDRVAIAKVVSNFVESSELGVVS